VEIRQIPCRHVVLALQSPRVIGIKLERPVVPGIDLQGTGGVCETVLAIVNLREPNQ